MAQTRKTRSTKSDIRKKLLDQERARMEERIDIMATLVTAVADIDELTLKASAAISDLQELGVTHADIELTTGLSSSRIAKVRREATALEHEDDDDDSTSPHDDDKGQDSDDVTSSTHSDDSSPSGK